MLAPNHVLLRCPNGHELQASREDLATRLSCPICGIQFTPGAAPVPAAPPAAPIDMPYTDGTLPAPVEPPAYAGWMILCWVASEVIGHTGQVLTMASPSGQKPTPLGGATMLSCIAGPLGIAAIVMQLMWVYRIHNDALRARRYADVSPGLALGLSFVPIFNFIWTAWSVRKLAAFAAATLPGDRRTPAITAQAGWLIAGGIGRAAAQLLGGGVGTALTFRLMAGGAMRPGAAVDPFEHAGAGAYALIGISLGIGLLTVLLYAYVIPKFQSFLYSALGAAPRP